MTDSKELSCHFCGRPKKEVRKILTSSCGGAICTDCIIQSIKMVFDEHTSMETKIGNIYKEEVKGEE